MPNGLIVPSPFGIHTRRTGWALYLFHRRFKPTTAFHFASSVTHKVLSTPAVFRPLAWVTRLTAIARAAKLVIISFCILRISLALIFLSIALCSFACCFRRSASTWAQFIFFQLLSVGYFVVILYLFSVFNVMYSVVPRPFLLPAVPGFNRFFVVDIIFHWLHIWFASTKSASFRCVHSTMCPITGTPFAF